MILSAVCRALHNGLLLFQDITIYILFITSPIIRCPFLGRPRRLLTAPPSIGCTKVSSLICVLDASFAILLCTVALAPLIHGLITFLLFTVVKFL